MWGSRKSCRVKSGPVFTFRVIVLGIFFWGEGGGEGGYDTLMICDWHLKAFGYCLYIYIYVYVCVYAFCKTEADKFFEGEKKRKAKGKLTSIA